jgi:uncharacterized protein (DUF1697 family)
MSTRIGFLRAVNVGRRKVAMARLRQEVEAAGFGDVWTFINSGNVVFDGAGSGASIERGLEARFEEAFGFEVTTFVRTAAELRRALQAEPFSLDPGDTYFLTFLKRPPAPRIAAGLEAASNDFDTLAVIGREVHWRMRGTSTDTSLTASTWRPLGELGSTSRNVSSLRKLAQKLDDGR